MFAAFVRLATARSIVTSLVDLERIHHHTGRRPAYNNTPLARCQCSLAARLQAISITPVGQHRPFFQELRSPHGLGEDVGHHLAGAEVLNYDFLAVHLLYQPEVQDVDAP